MNISRGAYIFERPFLRGLYSEEPTYEGKLQNRFGYLIGGRKFKCYCIVFSSSSFILYWRAGSNYKPP